MSTTEFWEGEPRLLNTYRISFENQQKKNDELAWLTGYYVYVAVQVNLYNSFKGSAEPARTYPDKPIYASAEILDEQERQKEQIRQREDKIKNRLKKSKKVLEEREQNKGR